MEHSLNGEAHAPAAKRRAIHVSPVYHEAKNELVRPHQTVFCSQYFVEKWMPRLGATATCIVLYLRSLGGSVQDGEVAVQVNQDDIAAAAGCSDRTVRREIRENAQLGCFVRTEDRYVRGERGHVRRVESVYYVAMDDPLISEDEPILAEIVNRKESAPATTGKKIVPENVLGQNGRIREAAVADNLAERMSADNLAERIIETYVSRNVSETNSAGTEEPLYKFLEEWRRTTEDLARYSAKELEDANSLGYHIMVWNHARKHDRKQGKGSFLTDGVFTILRELSERRASTAQPQGKAWTRRTRKWFEESGVPLAVKSARSAIFDEAELAEVRAALASAPFFLDAAEADPTRNGNGQHD